MDLVIHSISMERKVRKAQMIEVIFLLRKRIHGQRNLTSNQISVYIKGITFIFFAILLLDTLTGSVQLKESP